MLVKTSVYKQGVFLFVLFRFCIFFLAFLAIIPQVDKSIMQEMDNLLTELVTLYFVEFINGWDGVH